MSLRGLGMLKVFGRDDAGSGCGIEGGGEEGGRYVVCGNGAVALRDEGTGEGEEGSGEFFTGAEVVAVSEEDTGTDDGEGGESEGADGVFDFALGAGVEGFRCGIGTDGGDEAEGGDVVGEGKAGEGKRVFEIDFAEGFPGSGLADGGAEGTDDGAGFPPVGFGGQVVEIDEGVFEFGMRIEAATGGGDDGCDAGIGESLLEDGFSDESGGSGQEDGFHERG